MKYIFLTTLLITLGIVGVLIKQDTNTTRDNIGMCKVSQQIMTPVDANMTDAVTGYATIMQ